MSIRDDFPIFATNPDLIYLDSAATLMKPQMVIDGVASYLSNDYANIHRGAYDLSHRSEEIFRQARKNIAMFMWAKDESEVIFTSNSTDSVNLLVRSLIRSEYIWSGDEILLSSIEHHANILPRKMLAQMTGAKLVYIDIWSDSVLDPEYVYTYISDRTKIIALTLCSNVTGVIRDHEIKKISEYIYNLNTSTKPLLVVDASQYIVHRQLDVQDLWIDACFWTGHKLWALTGIWVLRWRAELLQQLTPWKAWGGAIESVHRAQHTYLWAPDKYEPWTPNIVAAHSLDLAIRYFCGLWGRDSGVYISQDDVRDGYIYMHDVEEPLMQHCQEQFAEYQSAWKLTLLGSQADRRIGVYSFVPHGVEISAISQAMQDAGIALRTWAHCAHIYHQELWSTLDECDAWCIVKTCRISLWGYTTMQELQRFWEVMGEVYV